MKRCSPVLRSSRARARYLLRLMRASGVQNDLLVPVGRQSYEVVVSGALTQLDKRCVENLLRRVGRSNQDLTQHLAWQMGAEHVWRKRFVEYLDNWVMTGAFFPREVRTVAAR